MFARPNPAGTLACTDTCCPARSPSQQVPCNLHLAVTTCSFCKRCATGAASLVLQGCWPPLGRLLPCRVRTLHALCELRLDRDDLQPLVDEAAFPKPGRRPQPPAGSEPKAHRGPTDSTDMGHYRPQPFARDAAGCSYWCIDSDASMRGGASLTHPHLRGTACLCCRPLQMAVCTLAHCQCLLWREPAPASQTPSAELISLSGRTNVVRWWGVEAPA